MSSDEDNTERRDAIALAMRAGGRKKAVPKKRGAAKKTGREKAAPKKRAAPKKAGRKKAAGKRAAWGGLPGNPRPPRPPKKMA